MDKIKAELTEITEKHKIETKSKLDKLGGINNYFDNMAILLNARFEHHNDITNYKVENVEFLTDNESYQIETTKRSCLSLFDIFLRDVPL